MPLVEVKNLHLGFGSVEILRGVSFSLEPGETLGIVGESGCGKSMTGLSLMGMIPAPGKITQGSIEFQGRDLAKVSEKEWRSIRGGEIAMVMQDPFSSLNPVMRVGDQIAEAIVLHQDKSKSDAFHEAVAMLDRVGVPDPANSALKYPHQMSGGQRQRVVIAIAFACHPSLLIADEPTTALDVTLQAQILELMAGLQRDHETGVVLISHDIGVIAEQSDRIAVFYAGRIVETGPTKDVLKLPQHPYTEALLKALPKLGANRLESITGQPPRFNELVQACSFSPRCKHRFEACEIEPELAPQGEGRCVACWRSSPAIKA